MCWINARNLYAAVLRKVAFLGMKDINLRIDSNESFSPALCITLPYASTTTYWGDKWPTGSGWSSPDVGTTADSCWQSVVERNPNKRKYVLWYYSAQYRQQYDKLQDCIHLLHIFHEICTQICLDWQSWIAYLVAYKCGKSIKQQFAVEFGNLTLQYMHS